MKPTVTPVIFTSPVRIGRAMETVETVERLMRYADNALANTDYRDPTAVAAAIAAARTHLDAAMEMTTTSTCSVVKSQEVSDLISRAATERVKPVIADAMRTETAVRRAVRV